VVVLSRWALSIGLAGTTQRIQSISAQTLRADFGHVIESFARKSRLRGRESATLAKTVVVGIGGIIGTSIAISLPDCCEEGGFGGVSNSQQIITFFDIDVRLIDLVGIAYVVRRVGCHI
jgi:hypothetical protein